MSRMYPEESIIPSVRATIIRSFRWKSFTRYDKKFPSDIFFDVKRKYKCKKAETVCKHIMGDLGKGERHKARILTSVEFLKALQFLRCNEWAIERETINPIIRRLSEWIVSRTDEYENAKWNF